ncbi:holin, partial [Coprobacillus sp. AM26-5AC]
DLSILAFLGWYVLASLIINEYRSILENLVEAGCDVPQVLIKGLEVASKKIDNFNENE